MSRFRASLGATLTAVAVAAIPSVLLSAPADAAAPVVVRVGPADLGPNGPWLRLQDDPGNAGRPPGVQEVSPFADPVRFDGSLHLAVAAAAEAQQAQAAHYFTSTVPLSTVAASPLSYDLYVKGSTSTPAAIPYGANLQLARAVPGPLHHPQLPAAAGHRQSGAYRRGGRRLAALRRRMARPCGAPPARWARSPRRATTR